MKNLRYDNKPKNDGFITQTRQLVGKAVEHSTPLVISGSLILIAAIFSGFWVISKSECGGSFSYKFSPYSQEFLLKKENCRPPQTTTKVKEP
ncbi:hypothetical protein [Aulosira sp. FACHB-615]|uniref:hypothetical protein n=1 Tax=Aulosira sp. FACHB-615 TaxID=2692777 RepID=UPI0016852522|nr:hypothetical protein [Aulosira sp. FACHB-615]MBD2488107.1 hypothetical protein [Aulosira sp. FACHB-615]